MIADVNFMAEGSVKITRKVTLGYILANYTDGDGSTWEEEFSWLENNHAWQLLRLARFSQKFGLPSPSDERITLGDDGRVWDGHHRLYVASILGLDTVEVDEWRSNAASV